MPKSLRLLEIEASSPVWPGSQKEWNADLSIALCDHPMPLWLLEIAKLLQKKEWEESVWLWFIIRNIYLVFFWHRVPKTLRIS